MSAATTLGSYAKKTWTRNNVEFVKRPKKENRAGADIFFFYKTNDTAIEIFFRFKFKAENSADFSLNYVHSNPLSGSE